MPDPTEKTPPLARQTFGQRWRKPLLFIGGLLLLFLLARSLGLGEYLKEVQPWIASLGPWAPLAFVGLYITASVLAIPGAALTLASGVLFGSFWGVVWASVGSTAAAAVCFLIARYLARSSLQKSLADNAHFQRLEQLTEKHGAWIVALTRMVPLFPFNLLNYGFGLTSVPFVTYVFWSWICMLPGTALYVVGVDAIKQAMATQQVPWAGLGVLAFLLLVLTLIGRLARQKMKALQESSSQVNQ
ncbi:MAG: TVP38/TMEM64 family protein [Candidatus Sericytochromatia bacterium]|nr:TVP38/TMEM64 family protein [Candidatus Sericytochromatia bacterium]